MNERQLVKRLELLEQQLKALTERLESHIVNTEQAKSYVAENAGQKRSATSTVEKTQGVMGESSLEG